MSATLTPARCVGLCSLVAMFPSTAWFFYHNRGVWVLVMICLTSNQYLGDVTFGFLVRVFGTIAGAAVGLLLWSIAAQTGKGNPFAVGAVCAVTFPFIFFYRVHMMPCVRSLLTPAFKSDRRSHSPMTAILPSITIMLVLGYSWQVGQRCAHPTSSRRLTLRVLCRTPTTRHFPRSVMAGTSLGSALSVSCSESPVGFAHSAYKNARC